MKTCWAWALALTALLAFSGSAMAGFLDGPNQIVILHDKETVEFMVQNTTNATQPVSLLFWAPMRYTVHAPATIAAHGTAKITLDIQNYPYLYHTVYQSLLQVSLGTEPLQKRIVLSFEPPVAEFQSASPSESWNGFSAFTGLFSLPAFKTWAPALAMLAVVSFVLLNILFLQLLSALLNGVRLFSGSIENIFQALLVIVIILLGIALFARMYNRVRGI